MFEKEAGEYADGKGHEHYNYLFEEHAGSPADFARLCFQDGAEFGYKKGQSDQLVHKQYQLNQLRKANEWHYVKDGLPKESGKYLVYVGGANGVFVLDFDTEANDFGYWCLEVASASLGVTDTVFETITERNEDKVIAWKEIVLPELKEIKENDSI